MEKVFCTHRPEVVFHAAAFKHVPIVEINPCGGQVLNCDICHKLGKSWQFGIRKCHNSRPDPHARDLIRLSGFKPDVDIEVKYIGLRPGEKLHEELITEGEGIVRTPYDKIFVLKGNSYDPDWLNRKVEELVEAAREQDAGGIKAKLKEIIPEYTPFGLQL